MTAVSSTPEEAAAETRRQPWEPYPGESESPEQIVWRESFEATVRSALDLGLQAWRSTDSRERFLDALAALDVLVAALRDARRERERLSIALDHEYLMRARWADRAERAERERDQAREQSRESSEMFLAVNEQVGELLSQQSFLERRLAAAREENARLAIEAATADQDWKRAEQALRRIERNAANNGDEFTRMLARAALGGAAEETTP